MNRFYNWLIGKRQPVASGIDFKRSTGIILSNVKITP